MSVKELEALPGAQRLHPVEEVLRGLAALGAGEAYELVTTFTRKA